ncbi:MAG: PilZ domain-containing protein [Gammaproteobacteria bacterium]
MNNERRSFPRVELAGEANILLAGVVRNGTLTNLSPAGIQIECRHQLIEQLNKVKSSSGLYPDFELEFTLPADGKSVVKSTCNVSYCRRLKQDCYHLGLNFVELSEAAEQKVSEYIHHSAAA